MEFQRSRIPRQAHRDTVLRFDREGARPAISRAGDMDLPASQLNIVFARVLHHRLANFLFRARAVSRLDRFILNEVLELIVREVRWDEFETDGNHYHHHRYAADCLDRSHSQKKPAGRKNPLALPRQQPSKVLPYGWNLNVSRLPSRALNHFHSIVGNFLSNIDSKGDTNQVRILELHPRTLIAVVQQYVDAGGFQSAGNSLRG